MATKRFQLKRGTTAQNDAYLGQRGELLADTQKMELRLHDGVKRGGYVVKKVIKYV